MKILGLFSNSITKMHVACILDFDKLIFRKETANSYKSLCHFYVSLACLRTRKNMLIQLRDQWNEILFIKQPEHHSNRRRTNK